MIDCDIHNSSPDGTSLARYFSPRWRAHHDSVGTRLRVGGLPPRPVPGAHRRDSWPPSGLKPGADLSFTRQQYLDPWNVEYAIVNSLSVAADQLNVRYGAALAAATNEWIIEEWLEKEARLRAAIVVPYENDVLACEEIERHAAHPGFVQILFKVRTLEPLGSRRYWRIYEAAERHGLTIGIHYGGRGTGAVTGIGKPNYYVEERAAMTQAFQAQVASMVCEGVFEEFGSLRVVLIEGGFAWLPSMMWRMDRVWQESKTEVPYLRRPPSDYVREHFWFTTQPIDEPARPEFFDQLLSHMGMDDRILFSSDYPHWDFDSPALALPRQIGTELRRKIMSENARALYGLDAGADGVTGT